MNKKREQREKLLAETFHDDWVEGPAATFALQAAALARRRRRMRHAVVASGIAASVAIALLFSLHHRPAPASAPLTPAQVAVSAPAYEIISDEELIAQLRDQPLLVLNKKDGGREFVLLGN